MIIHCVKNNSFSVYWIFWCKQQNEYRLLSGLMHQLFQLDIFAQTYSVQLRYIGDGIILYNGIHSFPKLVHQETIDGTLRDQLDNRVNYEPSRYGLQNLLGYRCSLTFFVRKYKLLMFIIVHASQTTCCAWHISGSGPRNGTIYFGYMLKIIGLHVPI